MIRECLELGRRVFDAIRRRARVCQLRARGVKIAANCWLQAIEIPRGHSRIFIKSHASLDRGVVLLVSEASENNKDDWAAKIEIGTRCYINRHTMIDASERIEIGSECMIGPFCYITDHDHGVELGTPIYEQPLISNPVVIEDGAWLGARVTVLKGVRIGKDSVVGAGAIVTKDVPENAIVAGVPAKPIRFREPPVE